MAKIPLPERGQPIDVSYIYQLANSLNQLSDQLNTTGYNYTTIDTPSASKQNIRTSETRIIAGAVSVTSNTSLSSGDTKTFKYDYNGNFKYTPIATATVVNTGGTGTSSTVAENATVIITSIDANSLSGLVRFNTGGKATTSVNLIIVGIPN